MPTNILARRISVIPWIVLLVALSTTAVGVYWRHEAVAAAKGTAIASARGHFEDVVSDHERRIHDGQREIEIVLLGAMNGGPDPIDAETVSSRLARLGSETIPGIRGFVLVDRNSDATPVVDYRTDLTDQTLAPIVDIASSVEHPTDLPWVTTMAVDSQHLTIVTLTVSSGDSLMALFDTDDFILGASEHQGHHVMAQLSRSAMTSSSVSEGSPMDSGVGDMPMGSISNREIASGHENSAEVRFVSTSGVDIYGQEWLLTIQTMDGFIEIQESREIHILIILGIALSLLIFGLIGRLVRSRMTAEHDLRVSAERFDTGFDRSPIGVAEVDSVGDLVKVNDSIATLLGRSKTELIGMSLDDFAADDADATEAAALVSGADDGQLRREVKYKLDDERELWVHQIISIVNGPGNARHTLVQMVDATERHRSRVELQRRAFHDQLTGLANRASLLQMLDEAVNSRRSSDVLTAVLFLDVDNFKIVNDSLGHAAGDELLRSIAARISDAMRDDDVVGRLGGDEFLVLCRRVVSADEAMGIARRILDTLVPTFTLGGRKVHATASIGVALTEPGLNGRGPPGRGRHGGL